MQPNRAFSPGEILSKKFKTLPWSEAWKEAFSEPENCGVWFVWGNSGNGKSSFVMQLVRELANFGKVFYNSLEEGTSLTMQHNLVRAGIKEVKRNVLIGREDMASLSERLNKRRSPDFVVIDSVQYTGITAPDYRKFREKHRNKLLIFISHAEGRQPEGRTAKSIKYDADLKIWVEGFKAISNGRYNPGGEYIVWTDGAKKYYGRVAEEETLNIEP
jgi:hypothetical protein